MPTGGSPQVAYINGREFEIPADNDPNLKIGGYKNSSEANGSGSGRLIKTRFLPGVEGLQLVVDESRGDLEYLQDLQDSKDYFKFSITLITEGTWYGRLQMDDEIKFSPQKTIVDLNLTGTGKLTRQ